MEGCCFEGDENSREECYFWEKVYLPNEKKHCGSLERFKAHLATKGFTHTYKVNYSKIFSLVAKLNNVQGLLLVAANLVWPLIQLDVKNAFLNGD
ncbi:hypothetical protein CR513_18563, partial [Mucuna pruriens]